MPRIRARDRKLAESTKHRDTHLDKRRTPAKLLAHCEREAKRLGVALVGKSSGGKLSKMSTTYYREIRLGTGYGKLSVSWQAVVLAHELVHARQWRTYGRVRFAIGYLASSRFRWAMEMQAYAETVRALVCVDDTSKFIEGYIKRKPGSMLKPYMFGRLRGVARETLSVLRKAHSIRRVG